MVEVKLIGGGTCIASAIAGVLAAILQREMFAIFKCPLETGRRVILEDYDCIGRVMAGSKVARARRKTRYLDITLPRAQLTAVRMYHPYSTNNRRRLGQLGN